MQQNFLIRHHVAESVIIVCSSSPLVRWNRLPNFIRVASLLITPDKKYKYLNVESVHALGCNCVSPKIAYEMAFNCANVFCSDWEIDTAGYATPVPESANRLIAFISIAYKNAIVFQKNINAAMDDPFACSTTIPAQ